ncbi:MAG: hypothetical protein RXR31_08930 [Thermoproteota archaeon]|jgi:hypothetical protein
MTEEKPNLAFSLSLAAGIFIFLASIVSYYQNFKGLILILPQ